MNSGDIGVEGPRAERLPNFPFPSLQAFEAACFAGTASPFVSPTMACRWARRGPYSSTWLNVRAWGLGFVPHIALVAFLVYAGLTDRRLFWAAPLLFVAYFLLNPISLRFWRIFAWGPLILTACGFIWALAKRKPELLAVTGPILAIWYSQRTLHRVTVAALSRAVTLHEDLFCSLWSAGEVGVAYPNGDILWADHKHQERAGADIAPGSAQGNSGTASRTGAGKLKARFTLSQKIRHLGILIAIYFTIGAILTKSIERSHPAAFRWTAGATTFVFLVMVCAALQEIMTAIWRRSPSRDRRRKA